MKNIFTRTIAAVSVLTMSGIASAELVSVDFNDFDADIMITDQIDGVTIGLLGAPEGQGPRTVNLTNPAYAPASGIALRPSGDMNGDRTANGGPWYDIVFEFDAPTDYFSILSLDSDEPVSATAFSGADIVDTISFRAGTNYQVWSLELGEVGGATFDRVVIDIVTVGNGYEPGPEFFDNMVFNRSVVPTPGAFTLLATSGLIAMRRKRFEG